MAWLPVAYGGYANDKSPFPLNYSFHAGEGLANYSPAVPLLFLNRCLARSIEKRAFHFTNSIAVFCVHLRLLISI